MRIFWAEKKDPDAGGGVSFGYSRHDRYMQKHLRDAGVEILDSRDGADLAVHFIPSPWYRPVEGMKNVLFTTAETDPLPACFMNDQINRETQTTLVVPCEMNRRVFSRAFPGVPIHVCPEGIEPSEYPYLERSAPYRREPFRFLWLGAWNVRKGYDLAKRAFTEWYARGDIPNNAELYLKTTGVELDGKPFQGIIYSFAAQCTNGYTFLPEHLCPPGFPRLPRITLDSRILPDDKMLEVYKGAHAFLAPHRGEGWGLQIGEAAATGLPVIYTNWSAPAEYLDEKVAYPLNVYKMTPPFIGWGNSAEPAVSNIVKQMKAVYDNYDEALKRGRLASERMHERYTWAKAASRFIEICEDVIQGREPEPISEPLTKNQRRYQRRQARKAARASAKA
jgi:glycosyltransferase involved in cell wall biosynthesis